LELKEVFAVAGISLAIALPMLAALGVAVLVIRSLIRKDNNYKGR